MSEQYPGKAPNQGNSSEMPQQPPQQPPRQGGYFPPPPGMPPPPTGQPPGWPPQGPPPGSHHASGTACGTRSLPRLASWSSSSLSARLPLVVARVATLERLPLALPQPSATPSTVKSIAPTFTATEQSYISDMRNALTFNNTTDSEILTVGQQVCSDRNLGDSQGKTERDVKSIVTNSAAVNQVTRISERDLCRKYLPPKPP
jgi:hypothetical protein